MRIRLIAFALLAVLALFLSRGADGGVQPSVGLYYTLASDPTVGGGQAAPLWQLLIRTDSPSIYYKSSTANTGWTRIGDSGGGGGGTVTSIDCLTGLGCTPDPIVGAGTINPNITTTTCAAGQAEITTAANGTSTCAVFVNAAGTGLSRTGSTIALNITPTTCAAGQAEVATASDGTSTCAPFSGGGSISGTANTLAKFATTTTLGNSSVTDDGTTWAINTNKVTVTEASGNTSIAGTLGTPNALFTATGGLTSTASTTTVGNFVQTMQGDTQTGTVADFSINANTTTVGWGPTGGSSITIQGFTGVADGRWMSFENQQTSGNKSLTVANNSGATTTNRSFNAGAAANVLSNMAQGNASEGAFYIYNATRSRWMEAARTGPRWDFQPNFVFGINLAAGTSRISDTNSNPTFTSCGTGPTVSTGSAHFTITTGTGATGCIINMPSNITGPTTTCNITAQDGVQVAYTLATTAITLTTAAASTKYDINCIMR